ncbi:Ti-type conjugative transfer relaxase TraA [Legionella erythra]|uniref:Conjugal transfer protein TraA n=1 Tax=Legionella erythra TaxID=448 RepID=A0A0W0TSU1_LEGER|nr:Ti-type conjugative transfer relaxase TraA [Legionella erythra]KTC98701.1 conjugal transfer protein TraA [Legionella erythra]
MAIAFARVSIHTRSKGHSAVAASAYRTASKLFDERTGTDYDYSRRREVVFSEIMLPEGASEKFQQREFLWNEVERAETRKNSQLCKDVVLALPKELSTVEHIELARRFAQTHFVDKGLPCDIAIHDDKDGNPHAHILVTLRRLQGEYFAKHKARDLNPTFAKGIIVEGDYWSKQWRSFQTDYFQEKNIDLAVDLNHLISEKHEGRNRDEDNHYLREENQLIREAREELALHDLDNLLNQLSLSHSVFTRKDIEKLLFKSIRSDTTSTAYLNQVAQLLAHKDVINLGVNDSGVESFTTRHQYIAESRLLSHVEKMRLRQGHVYSLPTEAILKNYQLNEEQRDAFHYITQSKDISVLIGRPGVGKSYLLKPIKEYFAANRCRVLGASLSGKVAKALQAETGIQSSTIASLAYRLSYNQMKLRRNDVLIIDEAGMVDFSSLAYLIEAASKAKAKVILVGDPDQLKPINKGEIFRGIAAYTGYIELDQIRRQRDEGDRMASMNLAKGEVNNAIEYYANKGAIHFAEVVSESQEAMVHSWVSGIHQLSDCQNNMMLAFSRAAVYSLNEQARERLRNKGMIGHEDFAYLSEGGEKTIALTQGERILLRQNDKAIGIRNGDLATILAVDKDSLTAQLDSGEQVIIPKTYRYIEYGYALTVHKAQGMTVDNVKVLIDSQYWDRNLSFVALTRHRDSVDVYANRHQHADLDKLTKTLSRSVTKDNVIDWPLDFALRAGFNPDSIVGKALNHIAGVGHKIKEKYNYLANYEEYLKQQHDKERALSKQERRLIAKQAADYMDEQSAYLKIRQQITKEAKQQNINISQHAQFENLYAQSLARDEKAHRLWTNHNQQLTDNPHLKEAAASIEKASLRYERYQTIVAIAQKKSLKEQNMPQLEKISWKADGVHISQVAKEFGLKPQQLYKAVQAKQVEREKIVFNELKQQYPVLAEYEKLTQILRHIKGYKAEQAEAQLQKHVRSIVGNKVLNKLLQEKLPSFVGNLAGRHSGKEFYIEK